jgi:hypothetical protein
MSQKRKPHDLATACRRGGWKLHPTLFQRFRVAFPTALTGDIGPAEAAMVMTHRGLLTALLQCVYARPPGGCSRLWRVRAMFPTACWRRSSHRPLPRAERQLGRSPSSLGPLVTPVQRRRRFAA